MSFSVEQTEHDLPAGFTVTHYSRIEGKRLAWETILRWCGLYLERVVGSNRFDNLLRLRERIRSRNN